MTLSPRSGWLCPKCGQRSSINDNIRDRRTITLLTTSTGRKALTSVLLACADGECGGYELVVAWGKGASRDEMEGEPEWSRRLVPSSRARVLPDYVPAAIREDYGEACAVEALSPKASATLARRALQGMIRDFWGISKSRLKDEIDALEDKVDPDTWAAIDALRRVGNIGAHMERDINVIVEVSDDEARVLINLIELLVDDWYVARENRQQRLRLAQQVAEQKEDSRRTADN